MTAGLIIFFIALASITTVITIVNCLTLDRILNILEKKKGEGKEET